MSKHIVSSFSYKDDKEQFMRELGIIAAREGKRKSEIIVSLIEEFVKAHSEGNPSFKLDIWTQQPDFKAMPTLLGPKDTWMNYEKECTEEELTKIAIAANTRLKEIRFIRASKDKK